MKTVCPLRSRTIFCIALVFLFAVVAPVTAGACTLTKITQYPPEPGLQNRIELTFSEAAYWQTALEDTIHLWVTVDGASRTVTTVPARAPGNAGTTVDIAYGGDSLTDGQAVSVGITDAGATLIRSAGTGQPMAAGATRSTVCCLPPAARPVPEQRSPFDIIYVAGPISTPVNDGSATGGLFDFIPIVSIPVSILIVSLVILAYVSRRRPPVS